MSIIQICKVITMSDDFELCIARISQCELSDHQVAIVNNLSFLISVREDLFITWFHII